MTSHRSEQRIRAKSRFLPHFLTHFLTLAAAMGAMASHGSAQAATGKLLLTGGVSSVEGAAGGGITPWAVIGTQAAEGETGFSAFATRAKTQDYGLTGFGAAIGYKERVEFSLAKQSFDTGPTGVALGLPGLTLKQDILGVKVKLLGDAILDSDTWAPQVAVGLQHKRLNPGGLLPTLNALGAKTSGTDIYISATKLLLAQGIVLSATLRSTKANQNGLLGFGSARQGNAKWMPEVSVAKLLSPKWAVGLEYRKKPDNLNRILGAEVLAEDDWKDVFVAWAPNPYVNVTAAYVDLGRIAPPFVARKQTGWYVSAQIAY